MCRVLKEISFSKVQQKKSSENVLIVFEREEVGSINGLHYWKARNDKKVKAAKEYAY